MISKSVRQLVDRKVQELRHSFAPGIDKVCSTIAMCEEVGKLAIGTYDGLVLCYRIWKVSEDCTSFPAEIPNGHVGYYAHLVFTDHPHDGAVRSLAGCRRYFASGGYDGSIVLYDLKTMKCAGGLSKHEDSVDALEFFESSYLLSGSVDKTIILWQMADQSFMKQFTGHTSAVTAMAISPTGKFMLSGGRDGALRMWDLMRAHNARTRAIGVCPVFIGFSEDSREFLFGYDCEVLLVEGSTETNLFTFKHDKPATCFSVNGRLLWVGCAGGHLTCWGMDNGECFGEFAISKDRLKMVKAFGEHLIILTSSGEAIVGIVSADHEVDTVLRWQIDGRITCGAYAPGYA
jgi:WD40 repeat protein